MMTNDGVQDTGCPLKVLHTAYAKRIPFFTGMHRFLPALILLQDAKIKQIPGSPFSSCSRYIQISFVEPVGFSFS